MPLDKFVLMMIAVIAAAGVTVAFLAWLTGFVALPGPALLIAVPICLIAYVIVRVIRDRMTNSEDSHYDQIER